MMFLLVNIVLVVLFVFSIALVVSERRERVIASLKEARTADAAVIKGLQEQVAALLEDKADLCDVISQKDHRIVGLVKEVATRQATLEQAFEEAWSLREKAEELSRKNLSLKKDRDKACNIADSLYRQ